MDTLPKTGYLPLRHTIGDKKPVLAKRNAENEIQAIADAVNKRGRDAIQVRKK